MGNIFDDTNENIEEHYEKQRKLIENKKLKNDNNSNKNYFSKNKININNFNSIRNEYNKQNKRYKNKTNINNSRRKTYSKEKDTIHFNKEIKREVINKKNRNTISYNKALASKKLTKNSKSNTNFFYNSIKKQSMKKNNKINYNMYTHLNSDLNDEDFIIDNDNDDLDESVQLIFFQDINSDNQKKELKKKLMKTKRQIMKIKKELHNNKEKSSINTDNKSNIHQDDLNIIAIGKKNIINTRMNNSLNNQVEINDKIIINDINSIENNKKNNKINKEKDIIINSRNNFIENNLNEINHNSISSNPKFNLNKSNRMNTKLNKISTNFQKKKKIYDNYHTESDLDHLLIKDNKNNYYGNDYKLHSSCNNLNIINKNNKNEKIINKLSIIKKKINNQFTPHKRKTYTVYDSKKIKMKRCETMNNKQIKNNIPAYRRSNFKVNNFYPSILNTTTYDSKKSKQAKRITNITSLESSFNKSFNISDLKANKLNKDKFINENKDCSLNKNNFQNNRDIFVFNKSNIQQSYINNSSIFKTSINDSNIKLNNIKNQRLFNLISNNFINNNVNLNNNNDKAEKVNKEKNGQQTLYQNREQIEIDLSPININESLINKDLLTSKLNNIITLNYNKLHNINTSIILYDGFLYKIVEDKNIGFKIIERYFKIMKNCFKYYPNLEKGINKSDKPLVQFDIRHIKYLSIVKNNILKQFKIKEKEIEFVLSIFLNQNDDFFVFAFNNKEIGNSVFNIINLLRNYYEDKSS